jgi:hypothetical protein
MNKAGPSLLLVALMISSMVIVTTVHFGKAQSGTNVKGIIYSETTWTQANSPYTFTGPVAVAAGVTLTIQAGVTVNMSRYDLQVNGTLYAIGTSSNPINLVGTVSSYDASEIDFTSISSSWNQQTSSGSIIQFAVLSDVAINVNNVSPKIDNDSFSDNYFMILNAGISLDNASAIITNNIFNSLGLNINYDSPIISNNRFIEPISTAISTSSNATISNNTISGASSGAASGIVANINDNSTIVGNLILNNLLAGSSPPTGEGITLINEPNSTVENNTIVDNPEGIDIANGLPTGLIEYNNIYGNLYNVYLSTSTSNISLPYNWWGTTDTQAINQTMYDYKDDYGLGNVTFVPFLTSPNTQAPTFVNATAGAGGSISPSGIVMTNYGGSQSFTITPNSGYYIVSVLVNRSSVGAVSTYTAQNIDGATTISATFAPNPTPTPAQSSTSNPTPNPTSPTQTTTSTSTPSPTAKGSSSPTVPEFSPTVLLFIILVVSVSALLTARKRRIRKN